LKKMEAFRSGKGAERQETQKDEASPDGTDRRSARVKKGNKTKRKNAGKVMADNKEGDATGTGFEK